MEEKWSENVEEGRLKYQLINIVAKRARQINEGFRPVVPAEGMTPERAALAEVKADKLRTYDPADRVEESEELEEE